MLGRFTDPRVRMETNCDTPPAAASGYSGAPCHYQAGGVIPLLYNEIPCNEGNNHFSTDYYGSVWQAAQPALHYATLTAPAHNAFQTAGNNHLWSSSYPAYFAPTYELQGGHNGPQPPVADVSQPAPPSGGGQHMDRGTGSEISGTTRQDKGGAASESQHDSSTSESGKGDKGTPCTPLASTPTNATSASTDTANSTQEMDLTQTPLHEQEPIPNPEQVPNPEPNPEQVPTKKPVPDAATQAEPTFSPISSPGQLSPSSSILNMDSGSDGGSLVHDRGGLLNTPTPMFSPTSPRMIYPDTVDTPVISGPHHDNGDLQPPLPPWLPSITQVTSIPSQNIKITKTTHQMHLHPGFPKSMISTLVLPNRVRKPTPNNQPSPRKPRPVIMHPYVIRPSLKTLPRDTNMQIYFSLPERHFPTLTHTSSYPEDFEKRIIGNETVIRPEDTTTYKDPQTCRWDLRFSADTKVVSTSISQSSKSRHLNIKTTGAFHRLRIELPSHCQPVVANKLNCWTVTVSYNDTAARSVTCKRYSLI